ncbi:MAG: hypothetical protein JWO97_1425 [Acidobacteria bacterium]|nr:hypothetical protein [Acidobacteriota bacterium]
MKTLADDWNELVGWFDSDRRIAIGIFVLALVTFASFHGGAGWNQDANFDLTRALVERRTVHIDGYSANTGDVSSGRGRHVYINKPPGLSFLATIPYAIVYACERAAGISPDEYARLNQWITTAATCGLCGALIGSTLFLYGRRRLGATARDSLAITLVILFGTIVFPYSTMLFAHVPPALFMLLAVVWMRERPLLAGMAAGLATICFYVCAPAALVLVLVTRSRRMIAGGAPFAILLGCYHWLCFESPFRTSVETSTPFTEKGLLFGVLRLPRADALYGLTLSPYRGLFFASPVLLFAFIGARQMWRARELRHEICAIAGSIAIYFVAICAFNQWNGGWAFGPRYLLPIVPLFGIPMLAAMPLQSRRARALFIAAALFSVATNFLATAVDAMPPPGIDNPLVDYLAPAFFTGQIPELTRDTIPWFHDTHVKPVALARDSGNVGELAFGAASRASLIPIVLWMLGGTAVLTSAASKRL